MNKFSFGSKNNRASLHPAAPSGFLKQITTVATKANSKARLVKQGSNSPGKKKRTNEVNADFDSERASESLESGGSIQLAECDAFNRRKKKQLSKRHLNVDLIDSDSAHEDPPTRKVSEEDIIESSGGSYNDVRKSHETDSNDDALSVVGLDHQTKQMIRPLFRNASAEKNPSVGAMSDIQKAQIKVETKSLQKLQENMGGQIVKVMKRINDQKQRQRRMSQAANVAIGISQQQIKKVASQGLLPKDAIAPVQEVLDCESGSDSSELDRSASACLQSPAGTESYQKNPSYNEADKKILNGVIMILGHKGFNIQQSQLKTEDREKSCLDCLVISNENWFAQVWPTLAIILSLTSSLHYAYAAGFIDEVTEPERETFYQFDIWYNIIFAFDLVLQFFFEYHDPSTDHVEKRFKMLAKRYLQGSFPVDFITVLPLYRLLSEHIPYARLLFLMKLSRLYRGIQLLNTVVILQQLKSMVRRRIERLIQTDKDTAEDRRVNNNFISQIVLFGHFVSITKLIIIMSCLSYLFGIAWYIFTSIEYDLALKYAQETGEEQMETFKTYFELVGQDPNKNYITMFYFAFTSLSTVGLGDYHPRSDVERFVGALSLLAGVTITSYVMENITQATRQIQKFLGDHEDGQMLSTFLNTMEKFNEGIPLDATLSKEIVDYFEYRWRMDRGFCFQSSADQFMLDQIPTSISRRIFMEFVYDDFLERYSGFFQHQQVTTRDLQSDSNPGIMPIDSSWDPDQYQALVMLILRQLEPKYINSEAKFLGIQQVCDEITFLIKSREATEQYDEAAAIEVGYNHHQYIGQQFIFDENNKGVASVLAGLEKHNIKRMHYPVRLTNFPVGALEIIYDQQSQFEYRVSRMRNYFEDSRFHHIDCLFIRRRNWKLIQNQAEEDITGGAEILRSLEKGVLKQYIERVFVPIQKYQEELVEQMMEDQKVKLKEELTSFSRAAAPSSDVKRSQELQRQETSNSQTRQKMIITQKVDLNPRRSSFLNNCGGLNKIDESHSVSNSSSSNDIILDKKQSLNLPVMKQPEDSFNASVALDTSIGSLVRPGRRSLLVSPAVPRSKLQPLEGDLNFARHRLSPTNATSNRRKSVARTRMFADLEAGNKIFNLLDFKGQESLHEALASSPAVQRGVQNALQELQNNNANDYVQRTATKRQHQLGMRAKNSSTKLVLVPQLMQISNRIQSDSYQTSSMSEQSSDEEIFEHVEGAWQFQVRDLDLLNLIKENLGEYQLHPQDRRILKEVQPEEETQESDDEHDVLLEHLQSRLEYQEDLIQSVINRFDRAMDLLAEETRRRIKVQKLLRDVLNDRKVNRQTTKKLKPTQLNNYYHKKETKRSNKSLRRSHSSDRLLLGRMPQGRDQMGITGTSHESLHQRKRIQMDIADVESIELPPVSETKADACHECISAHAIEHVGEVDMNDLPDMTNSKSPPTRSETSGMVDVEAIQSQNYVSVAADRDEDQDQNYSDYNERDMVNPERSPGDSSVKEKKMASMVGKNQMPAKPFMPLRPRQVQSKKNYGNINYLKLQAPPQDDTPLPMQCSSPAIATGTVHEGQEAPMLSCNYQSCINESMHFLQDNNDYPELSQAFTGQRDQVDEASNLHEPQATIPDDLPSGSWRNSVNSASIRQLKSELTRAYEVKMNSNKTGFYQNQQKEKQKQR